MTRPIKITDSIKCMENSKTMLNSCVYGTCSRNGKDYTEQKEKHHPLKSPRPYTIKRVGGEQQSLRGGDLLIFKIK